MAGLVPMPLVDDFLLDYHVGHAVLVLLVVTVPAGLVKGSRKMVALILLTFGGLLVAVPSIDSDAGIAYAMLGLVLLVVGPVMYTTATR